ncbi:MULTISPECIES: WxL domain-containing protein [unclassified Enterococcus]|jgi:hypothetical protein|uniref:WxL domain-containing protein n=1 Tax=unclassified Enterococcus TaxID=2608891 RepID=UPI003D27D640
MKKQIFISAATVMLLSLTGGKVFATSYPDGISATTDAAVAFNNDAVDPENPIPPIVDPENPEEPGIDPEDPNPNPPVDGLHLSYVSDFNFGEGSKNTTTFYAEADTVNNGERSIVPFVATNDSRGTDRTGWTLSAKLDAPLTNDGHELAARLSLENLNYAIGGDHTADKAPEAASGEIVLIPGQEQVIASANTVQGIGSWSLALGQLNEEKTHTNGVKLVVPSTSVKNTGTYSSSLSWTLTAQP